MLTFYFENFSFVIPFIWSLTVFWTFFFFFNISYNRVRSFASSDKVFLKTLKLKENSIFVFFDLVILQFLFLFLFFFFIKGWQTTLLFDNFLVNNSTTFIIFFIYLIFFFTIVFLRSLNNFLASYDFDFFFSFINFYIFINFFFITKSFLSFFFILEILSCFVFYQFITSKIFFYKVKNSTTSNFSALKNKQILSVLFFQYWASFFSSVILIYVISLIVYNFGTTDWYILNFLISENNFLVFNVDFFFFLTIFFLFTFAFFIKLGFSPIQLFKIEIYKGLPFLSIFFYTTFYFFVYFFIFTYITFVYFSSLWLIIWYFFFFFLFIGSVYILNLLFDVKFIKAFFAYSTIINSIGFLSLFVILIS